MFTSGIGVTAVLAAMSIGAAATASVFGPDWGETGDAGSLPGSAQVPSGAGMLSTISGTLSGANPGVDFEDMYLIRIIKPQGMNVFFAHTNDPQTNFDTELWLFDINGFGLLGNDDISLTNTRSFIRFPADDPPPIVPPPGLYYLAISGFNNNPQSNAGDIFLQQPVTQVSGPDGPGGALPINAWNPQGGATGQYLIRLRGVVFVPAPGAAAALLMLIATARRRRR